MAKINTTNYQPVTAWNGTQDLLIVEQPDGTKVATPEQVKQYVEAGDFEATGEIIDGHGNILKDMASGIQDITRTIIYDASNEDAFLLLAYADILADMGPFVADSPRCVTRVYTAVGIEHYVIQAYRVQAKWIYSICFTEGKVYYISYDCNNHSIKMKKSFTLT